MLNLWGLNRIEEVSRVHLLWVWTKQYLALSNATLEILWHHAHLSHRRFTRKNKVSVLRSRSSDSD